MKCDDFYFFVFKYFINPKIKKHLSTIQRYQRYGRKVDLTSLKCIVFENKKEGDLQLNKILNGYRRQKIVGWKRNSLPQFSLTEKGKLERLHFLLNKFLKDVQPPSN